MADKLPVAKICLNSNCSKLDCRPIISAAAHKLRRYRADGDGVVSQLFKNTAAITDFGLFADAAGYFRAVSKETKGKYHRSANKARRAGFFVAEIHPGSHAQSLFDIKASKARRSHGLVSEAVGIGKRPETDVALPPQEPECREHWRMDWGLFSKSNDRMWGFASLIRAGNIVHLDHMMCHADVLDDGGMKLLHFDIMARLFDRSNANFAGLDYLIHGAIEDGGQGAADWRRYVQQKPFTISIAASDALSLPPDFDARAYLELNPDVKAAGRDPRKHYLQHGMLEGRAYKGGPSRPA